MKLAVIVCVPLPGVMVAPAFAQPFGDTPAPHWARDPIATLAAKRLIEGYPDGTLEAIGP